MKLRSVVKVAPTVACIQLILFCFLFGIESSAIPVVVTTWKFTNATHRAWAVLNGGGGSALDAVEAGCGVCEYEQCDFTVGFGGSPDEKGETTLDAMVMDGSSMNVGAVGGLRRIKNAVGVARKVMETTRHTFLVGEWATQFGISMGFPEENLATSYSKEMYDKWKNNNCQPNFRQNVFPNPLNSCGPYKPYPGSRASRRLDFDFGSENHDTIGMVVVDGRRRVASGTSTNGARYKVPGRVGDSPVAGAGSYADDDIGGAAATGDGDIMMRFLPSFFAVEEMRNGKTPDKAAQQAVLRIAAKHHDFMGAVVALRKDGKFGAACFGMETFPYTVYDPLNPNPIILYKSCIKKTKN